MCILLRVSSWLGLSLVAFKHESLLLHGCNGYTQSAGMTVFDCHLALLSTVPT